MKKFLTKKRAQSALQVVDSVMEVVPTVVAAAASSSPLAWGLAALTVVRKATKALPDDEKVPRRRISWGGSSRVAREKLLTLVEDLVEPEQVMTTEEFGGVSLLLSETATVKRYGQGYWISDKSSVYGPYGEAGDLVDALWEKFNIYEMTLTGDMIGISMTRYGGLKPPRVTVENTERVVALKEAGRPVGVHLNGTYGSGKTYAAHYMATALGDRTLRVSISEYSVSLIKEMMVLMDATTVILDDVDRGSTSHLLSLCDEVINDKKICVIGTSNNRKRIDSAFERAGRVDIRYTYGTIEPDTLEQLCEGKDISNETQNILSRYTVATVAGFLDKMEVWGEEYTLRWLASQATHDESAQKCGGEDEGILPVYDDDLIDEDPP